MKCLRQEFKAKVEIHLFVRERALVFRDLSTPARQMLNKKTVLKNTEKLVSVDIYR